jgi:hypothetical protein
VREQGNEKQLESTTERRAERGVGERGNAPIYLFPRQPLGGEVVRFGW